MWNKINDLQFFYNSNGSDKILFNEWTVYEFVWKWIVPEKNMIKQLDIDT